ncbi:hypothetical protein [Micromonospora sp. NPDC051006]|uniref:hypothetical protein n=1 Tax=Micromonospora sp. NPDC051006 TaxID=3364283 RepID=UPI0037893D02
MAKPKGPHGDGGDGSDGGDGGVPRPRRSHNGKSTTIAEGHQAIAEAAADGRPGGPGSRDGKPTDSQGDGSDSRRAQNDPELGKHDKSTLEEIEKARKEVAPRLQELVDEAWDHVDQNKDEILQREGYQRQREELIAKGYPDEVADLIVERTAMGTEAHRQLANSIDAEANTLFTADSGFRLRTEIGFDSAGVETRPVRDQEFRPDVILERQYKDPVTGDLDWEVAHAYDLKTGLKTGIAPGWANNVQTTLDLPNAPEELRPTKRPLGG